MRPHVAVLRESLLMPLALMVVMIVFGGVVALGVVGYLIDRSEAGKRD